MATDTETYIRQAALARGLDPDMAVRTAMSEGGVGQFRLGDSGKSGGPFQLYTGGGLGNDFQRATGLNPLDPKNERAGIDYALDYAAQHGFDPNIWHGLRRGGGGDKMQTEGQYGGALHLNVQPHDPVADALLSGIISQAPKQETQERPQGEPLDFLSSILARVSPQQQQQAAPQQQQQPKPVEPIPPPANVLAQTPPLAPMEAPQRPPIPATPAAPPAAAPVTPQPTPAVAAAPPRSTAPNPLQAILGIAPAAAAEIPRTTIPAPVAAPPQPRPAPQPAPPPAAAPPAAPPPEQQAPAILDRILQAITAVGDPESEAAAQASKDIEKTGLPQALGETATQLFDMFVGDPIRASTSVLSGETPVGSPEAIEAGIAGSGLAMGGSMGRGGLGAGPRFPGGQRTALGREMAATQVSRGIQHIFSPTTVDETSLAAEASIRQEVGLARRTTAQTHQQFEPSRPLVAPYIPEFQRWINADPATRAAMDDPALMKFIDYIENRSRNAPYDGPPELAPLADDLRDAFQDRRMAIAAEPRTATVSFVEDYFPHLWKEMVRAKALAQGAPVKQGSGANLRRRSVPTLRDGIEAGLTPVSPDPVEMSMRYVANMDRYLATNRAFDIGVESGMIRWLKPGEQPDGWTQLNGRLSETPGTKAYAPDGYATVYNNFIDPGWYSDPYTGAAFDVMRRTMNAITFMKLAIPGYHAMAMAQEGAVSGLANAIGKLKDGDIAAGLKAAGLSGVPLEKTGEMITKGHKFQRQYLGISDYGPDFEKIVQLGAKAGMRAVGRGAEYHGSAMDNYWKAWKRGALGMQMRDAAAGIRGPFSVLGTMAREFGRLMETISAPVFEGMIPRLKNGAFFDEMSDWMRAHPDSLDHEQTAAAREIWDSIDNRFGEMVLDNVFWNQRAKQTLQLLVTSVGWELGTIREIGGGMADIMRGKWTPRTRYVLALPVIVGISNAVYQFLKTGKSPGEDQGGLLSKGGALDLVAPRTGGQTPEGQPERAILPGYEKDVIGYWHSPLGEAANKLSPGASLGKDLVTGRDYFGNQISTSSFMSPDWIKDYAKHVASGMTPIPFSQEYLKGTNIGAGERFFGPRPAPAYIEDPKRYDEQQLRREMSRIRGEIRGTAVHAGRTTEGAASAREKIKRLNEEADRLSREFRRKYPGGMQYQEAPAR